MSSTPVPPMAAAPLETVGDIAVAQDWYSTPAVGEIHQRVNDVRSLVAALG